MRNLLYSAYERRLVRQLQGDAVPRHVGMIVDGNRRFAKARGRNAADGHQAGAANIASFLEWCEEAGVEVVTLWLLSTDNLTRTPEELERLLRIIEGLVADLAEAGRWQLHAAGALELLPVQTAAALRRAEEETADVAGLVVNVAVGYGGRQEIADAVRSLLRTRAAQGATMEEVADEMSADDISAHLYTKGQPDPDLVIRTSGEQRLSGFLMWQSAHSEYYFCEVYWPEFRRVDFLRALRSYADRHRRYGS
ncbi:isoprenyl transferase [Janibacter corallicola]|uniref:isoprenyl transferase n=1 Tax=Janibacter corallicola TaxID=415212 RepID=UPI00082970A4|nr:isoprenyl transferase [Janibacter corallicola]